MIFDLIRTCFQSDNSSLQQQSQANDKPSSNFPKVIHLKILSTESNNLISNNIHKEGLKCNGVKGCGYC